MKRLYVLTLCSIVLSVCVCLSKKKNQTTIPSGKGLVIPKEWLVVNKNPLTPKPDVRPADQTFLTFPEWFLVFSPEEQANYFSHHTSTDFPFMSHIAQIWESYAIVNDQIKGNFPTNTGYHFMIWVIGTSASVEYAIKSWYELIFGRITDTGIPSTTEDKFNAVFTQDYVDFIKMRPWYEFNFKNELKNLWMSSSLFGKHFLRKSERKYILTSELLVKYLYGKLIGLGTKQVYEEALPTTAVINENGNIHYLPRYDKFTLAITELSKKGKAFKEISGNDGAILMTVLVPSNNKERFEYTRTVFTQPISSDRTKKRVALVVQVPSLNKLLLQLDHEHIDIEHIFDF